MAAENSDAAPALPATAEAGPVSHALFRTVRLHRMIAGQLLRKVGLYTGQEVLMMHLWDRGPQRQIDLVRLLDSDAATITRTIQRLEHAGFVRRTPCPTDKRVTIVEPTPASHALRAEVHRMWAELEESTVGDMTAEERQQALDLLARMEARLTRAAAPTPARPAARPEAGGSPTTS